jgi:hypothetical protein
MSLGNVQLNYFHNPTIVIMDILTIRYGQQEKKVLTDVPILKIIGISFPDIYFAKCFILIKF